MRKSFTKSSWLIRIIQEILIPPDPFLIFNPKIIVNLKGWIKNIIFLYVFLSNEKILFGWQSASIFRVCYHSIWFLQIQCTKFSIIVWIYFHLSYFNDLLRINLVASDKTPEYIPISASAWAIQPSCLKKFTHYNIRV